MERRMGLRNTNSKTRFLKSGDREHKLCILRVDLLLPAILCLSHQKSKVFFISRAMTQKKKSGGKERPREGGKEDGGGRRKEEKGGGREVILPGLSIFTKRSVEIFIPSWIEAMTALTAVAPTFPGCNTDQRWNFRFSECFPFLFRTL